MAASGVFAGSEPFDILRLLSGFARWSLLFSFSYLAAEAYVGPGPVSMLHAGRAKSLGYMGTVADRLRRRPKQLGTDL